MLQMPLSYILLLVPLRKHDCKHIRLILQSLGVAGDPGAWRQVRGEIQAHVILAICLLCSMDGP